MTDDLRADLIRQLSEQERKTLSAHGSEPEFKLILSDLAVIMRTLRILLEAM
jgi:hypothetical protein